ncbi:hypothetical protein DF19_17485 [Streptomyces olindensis]|nr:hypothetical protein DF19_17485 [Streptomyces olindensis]
MGQEGCRAVQGPGWEVGGQGVAYGGGGDVAFEPGGDAGGEKGGVVGGKKEASVVAGEAREEVRGLPEEDGGEAGRLRHGGEGFAAVRPRPFPRGRAGSASAAVPWLVAGDRAGDDPAAGDAFAYAPQVAVGRQFAQGGGGSCPPGSGRGGT